MRFIVMEFLDGETLEEILARRKRLPVGEAVPLMIQAMQGLQQFRPWKISATVIRVRGSTTGLATSLRPSMLPARSRVLTRSITWPLECEGCRPPFSSTP